MLRLLLLRGPIIVLIVILSLILPQIQDYCTWNLFLHLIVGSIGVVWIVCDVWTIVESRIRSGLNFILRKIVVDDVLRAIFDPNDGFWACMIGTFIGASSMYGLNMDDEEKTELIQSSLYITDKNEARGVLLEPGGCAVLLPNEVKNWLQPTSLSMENSSGNRNSEISIGLKGVNDILITAPNIESVTISSADNIIKNSPINSLDSCIRSNNSDCDITDIIDRDIYYDDDDDDDYLDDSLIGTCTINSGNIRRSRQEHRERNIETAACSRAIPNNTSGTDSSNTDGTYCDDNKAKNQNDPATVFLKILKRMMIQKMKPYARSIPQSTIENVGITSVIVALGMKLIECRKQKSLQRQQSRFYSLIGPLICAGIASVSFGTILSKEIILGNISDKQTLILVCNDIVSRLVHKIKGNLVISNKRKRGLLAMLLFMLPLLQQIAYIRKKNAQASTSR